jgi:hypothetical protein
MFKDEPDGAKGGAGGGGVEQAIKSTTTAIHSKV